MKIKIIKYSFAYILFIILIQEYKSNLDKLSLKNRCVRRIKNTFTEIKPDKNSTSLRLSTEKLGKYSWSVLHSIAANYPTKPTIEDKNNIEMFLKSFSMLFPCNKCQKHFKKMIEENKIRNNSREELVYYICDLHNIVNKRLHKPIFDCKKAFSFWGGDCGCSNSNK